MASTAGFDCEDASFSGRQTVGKRELLSHKKCAVYCSRGVVFGASMMIGFFVLGPLFKHAMTDQEAVNRSHTHSLRKNFILPASVRANTRHLPKPTRADPMMAAGLRVGDMVEVLSGSDKKKVGKILSITKSKNKDGKGKNQVVVEGMNVKTKHVKPVKEGESGKKVKKEYPIDLSNVRLNKDASETKEGDTQAE